MGFRFCLPELAGQPQKGRTRELLSELTSLQYTPLLQSVCTHAYIIFLKWKCIQYSFLFNTSRARMLGIHALCVSKSG